MLQQQEQMVWYFWVLVWDDRTWSGVVSLTCPDSTRAWNETQKRGKTKCCRFEYYSKHI